MYKPFKCLHCGRNLGACCVHRCQGNLRKRNRIFKHRVTGIIYKGNGIMEKTFKPTCIKFSELSPEARQQFCNWTYKGKIRHLKDLAQIEDDLEHMKWKYNIEPQDIYNDWIEVTE